MIVKSKYVAFDETEFDNAENCIQYEWDILGGSTSVIMYDGDNGIPTIGEDEPFTDFIDRAYSSAGFIYIEDPKAAEPFIKWVSDYYGYDTDGLISKHAKPNTAYYYDESDEKWKSFESYFDYGAVLKFVQKEFEEALKE